MGRYREQQARRHKGVGDPAQPLGARRARRRRGEGWRWRRMAAITGPAERDADRQHAKPVGPGAALLRQGEGGFDDQRIGEQRQQAARVARGIEEIRVAGIGVAGPREPALQQRRRGGDREKGRSDGSRETCDQPRHWAAIDRRHLRRQVEGQEQDGHAQHARVDRGLREPAEPRCEPMRIGVAEQQHRLKEHHAGVPHRRGPAQEG